MLEQLRDSHYVKVLLSKEALTHHFGSHELRISSLPVTADEPFRSPFAERPTS